jgi:LacI family transcriptional regulator
VTLTEVARRAGVSVATASKALNARPDVAPETRTRVLAVAEELSFQPNALARGLLSGSTRTVGLLTDELAGRFAIPVLLGVENALGDGEMSVLLCDARGDAVRRRQHIRTLLARQVDGLIVLGDRNDVRESLTAGIPVPVVYAYGQSDDPGDLSVVADDVGGARLAAEHLLALGHRRIVFCGPTTTPSRVVAERLRGFRAALETAGVAWDDALVVPANTSFEEGLRAGGVVAAEHPDATAVLATADILAAGLEKALARAGRRVPDDVSVVGYDDTDVAEYVTPSLTTVRQDVVAKGRAAATLLLEMIDGGRPADPPRLGVELVVRESTAPPPSPSPT